jgi:hypothetical protein
VRGELNAKYPHLYWTAEGGTYVQIAALFTAMDVAGAEAFPIEQPRRAGADNRLATLKADVAELVVTAVSDPDDVVRFVHEQAGQCALLRCIFGNPFRPVTVNPAWLAWNGGTVFKLAQAAYENRDLPSGHLDTSRLSILADALEEAGCSDADLLAHLRGPGPHCRGCWAVDLILGKH